MKVIEVNKSHKKSAHKSSLVLDMIKGTLRSVNARVGAIILLLLIILCVGAPMFTNYSAVDMDLTSVFAVPGTEGHLLGTDDLGRDLWARVLYGGRYSLALGFITALLGTLVAIVIGSVAGYFGGIVENAIMRAMDVLSALPSILLCILVATVLGSGFFNTVMALTIGQIVPSIRMMRASILSERTKEYLEAARSINCSTPIVMFKHLLPNCISPMIVCLTMGIGDNIAMAASLSYIGLGVHPPTPEWGALLASAKPHILNHPYLIIIPGIFIALTVLGANLLGDGLRDAMDPKLRK